MCEDDISDIQLMLKQGWSFTSFQRHLIAAHKDHLPRYLTHDDEWRDVAPVLVQTSET